MEFTVYSSRKSRTVRIHLNTCDVLGRFHPHPDYSLLDHQRPKYLPAKTYAAAEKIAAFEAAKFRRSYRDCMKCLLFSN